MNYRNILATATMAAAALTAGAQAPKVSVFVNTDKEPIHEGRYEPTWESLSDYICPEWFRDAKFGIWAHWGPQCQPEHGDWFARGMYEEGSGAYKFSREARDHQTQFGFKDWIHEWKAERWNPEALVALYKECGAKYFFALANHHDNFDLYDSKYQPWNSTNMGPEKDIIGGWAAACKKLGLPLGVSVHAAHAWSWYEVSRGADKGGALAGQTYDGRLTKADGQGTWWEGYDPQDLYEQRHPLSPDNRHWDWDPARVTTPDQAYCDRFYNRTIDLINKYNPDVLYFDDTVLPLYPFSDAGLKILAHMYNKSMAEHKGKNMAVVTGKVMEDWHKKALMWDVERGAPDKIQAEAWQTCTCIGQWHYDKNTFYNGWYKSPQTVIQMLVDVVSKNGNLLLSVPLKGDGTPDTLEVKIVRAIGAWLKQNGESIYGTRPWTQFGEGPNYDQANPINAQGFNEGKVKYTAADVRYVQKAKQRLVYATLMDVPEAGSTITLKAVKRAKRIEMLGVGPIDFQRTKEGITLTMPAQRPNDIAAVLKIQQ